MISFLLDIHWVGFLDHTVVLFLTFWGISVLFSLVALPIYIPTSSAPEYSFPHQPLLTVFWNPYPLQWKHGFLTTGLPGKALNCLFDKRLVWGDMPLSLWLNFLMISDVVSTSIMSFLKVCLFSSYAHLKTELFVFFFFCHCVVWIPNIFWILTPYHLYYLQIFPPLHSLALLLCSFLAWCSPTCDFCLCCWWFRCHPKNNCQCQGALYAFTWEFYHFRSYV